MVRLLACFALSRPRSRPGRVVAGEPRPAPLPATVSDGAGPFQSNAIATPRRSKIGTGHVLVGRIVAAPDCGPVRRASVYLWQAGPNGYGPRGRARVLTDRQGRFRFEGLVPAD